MVSPLRRGYSGTVLVKMHTKFEKPAFFVAVAVLGLYSNDEQESAQDDEFSGKQQHFYVGPGNCRGAARVRPTCVGRPLPLPSRRTPQYFGTCPRAKSGDASTIPTAATTTSARARPR